MKEYRHIQTTLKKKKAKEAIDELSEDKVKVAIDFLNYLKEKEDAEATLEILSSNELMEQIRAAEEAIKADKIDEFVEWDKVKRNV
ncbi:MAG: hypothetical protein NG784_00925 [Candidatus Jettenia sp.]|nr:hypothetical protein [Candidatus Jettenia sp.]